MAPSMSPVRLHPPSPAIIGSGCKRTGSEGSDKRVYITFKQGPCLIALANEPQSPDSARARTAVAHFNYKAASDSDLEKQKFWLARPRI